MRHLYMSSSEYDAIMKAKVISASSGSNVNIGDLWGKDDTCIFLCLRSFGWFFCQELARIISRDVVPLLATTAAKPIKLVCIGIGTHSKSLEFAKHVNFPEDMLYADPENAVYDKLELIKSSPLQLITDPRTPLSIAKRFADGSGADLSKAISNWKVIIPPKLEQGFQQGGAYVFDGVTTLYGRKDPATGDHADINLLLEYAVNNANK